MGREGIYFIFFDKEQDSFKNDKLTLIPFWFGLFFFLISH